MIACRIFGHKPGGRPFGPLDDRRVTCARCLADVPYTAPVIEQAGPADQLAVDGTPGMRTVTVTATKRPASGPTPISRRGAA